MCIPTNLGSVQGMLEKHSSFWRDELKVSEHILGIVSSGYKLPFIRFPKPCFQENYKCSISDQQFIASAIAELVANNCAQRVTEPPIVCSPLQVVVKDGSKRRLVIDLLHKFKFGLRCGCTVPEGKWLAYHV